jgi:hypothetical protein
MGMGGSEEVRCGSLSFCLVFTCLLSLLKILSLYIALGCAPESTQLTPAFFAVTTQEQKRKPGKQRNLRVYRKWLYTLHRQWQKACVTGPIFLISLDVHIE